MFKKFKEIFFIIHFYSFSKSQVIFATTSPSTFKLTFALPSIVPVTVHCSMLSSTIKRTISFNSLIDKSLTYHSSVSSVANKYIGIKKIIGNRNFIKVLYKKLNCIIFQIIYFFKIKNESVKDII